MIGNINSYLTTANETDCALMSVNELAEYLGIGKNRAYELLNTGTIKGFRIGSIWKVSRAAVDKFICEKSGLLWRMNQLFVLSLDLCFRDGKIFLYNYHKGGCRTMDEDNTILVIYDDETGKKNNDK